MRKSSIILAIIILPLAIASCTIETPKQRDRRLTETMRQYVRCEQAVLTYIDSFTNVGPVTPEDYARIYYDRAGKIDAICRAFGMNNGGEEFLGMQQEILENQQLFLLYQMVCEQQRAPLRTDFGMVTNQR